MRRKDRNRTRNLGRDTAAGADRESDREAERGVLGADRERHAKGDEREQKGRRELSNPAHTTKDGITAPKFGSAVSGGGDIEPAPGT
jgi:hypothetical protein